MSYKDSITQIEIAEAAYNRACDHGDLIEKVLADFFFAKGRHVGLFGSLRRFNGQWV